MHNHIPNYKESSKAENPGTGFSDSSSLRHIFLPPSPLLVEIGVQKYRFTAFLRQLSSSEYIILLYLYSSQSPLTPTTGQCKVTKSLSNMQKDTKAYLGKVFFFYTLDKILWNSCYSKWHPLRDGWFFPLMSKISCKFKCFFFFAQLTPNYPT